MTPGFPVLAGQRVVGEQSGIRMLPRGCQATYPPFRAPAWHSWPGRVV